MKYIDRHKTYPGVVIISYNQRWGGQLGDKRLWLGELDGEVYDYDGKNALAQTATEEGLNYVVLRVHNDMTTTILDTSIKKGMVTNERIQNDKG